MMNNKKTYALVALLLLITISACSSAAAVIKSTSNSHIDDNKFILKPTHLTTSDTSNNFIRQVSYNAEHIYLLYGYDYVDHQPSFCGIEVLDKQLNPVRKIDNVPHDENYDLASIAVCGDGSYWTLGTIRENDKKQTMLHYFSQDGHELLAVDLSQKYGVFSWYYKGTVDKNNGIYIITNNGAMSSKGYIYLIDTDGELAAQWEFDEYFLNLGICVLDNGKTIVSQENIRMPTQFYELKESGTAERIGEYYTGVVIAPGVGNFVYINIDQDIYKLSLDTFTTEHILNYTDFEGQMFVKELLRTLVVFSDEEIYGYINGRIHAFERPIENEELLNGGVEEDLRQIISIATYGPNLAFNTAVHEFNSQNEDYKMVVTDYSKYDNEANGAAGRLSLEIISGKIPDMFFWGFMANQTGFDAAMYASSGLFADMYEYLDKDPTYSRDSFIPNILDALESSDGTLCELPFDFIAGVVACNREEIPLEKWNFDEFYVELEKHPEAEFIYGSVTKEIILYLTLSNNWDEFIDWRTGACNFDSESFHMLLEFCKDHVGDLDDLANYSLAHEAIADGMQYLVYNVLSNVSAIQKFKAMFGAEVTFIGFPTEKGRGNSIQLVSSASIYDDSPCKDICWEFLRQFCDPEYQLSNFEMLPTNAKAIEERLRNPAKYEDIGASITYYGQKGEPQTVVFIEPNEDEIAQMRQLIYSLDRVHRLNMDLVMIILEDASTYFSGQRTAEETAKIIQSKVSIYLSERS